MPLFGRHRARNDYANANVTPKRRGWALFNPYSQRNRTNPNNTATRSTFKWRSTNDAVRVPARRSRRIGRTNAAPPVPLVTKVMRTLGIQSQSRQPQRRLRKGGLFRKSPRVREHRVDAERNRGWFSGRRSGGRYRK